MSALAIATCRNKSRLQSLKQVNERLLSGPYKMCPVEAAQGTLRFCDTLNMHFASTLAVLQNLVVQGKGTQAAFPLQQTGAIKRCTGMTGWTRSTAILPLCMRQRRQDNFVRKRYAMAAVRWEQCIEDLNM